MWLPVHIYIFFRDIFLYIYPRSQICFAHCSMIERWNLQDKNISALLVLQNNTEWTATYYFLPLHPSVLVPRFYLQLTQSQRFRQIYSVVNIKRQHQKFEVLLLGIFNFERQLAAEAHMCGWLGSVSSAWTHLSGVDRYFCFSKRFSRPISCSSVNTVRLRRPFLLLIPPSLPCSNFPRRCKSSGRWWEAAPTCSPGDTERSGAPRVEHSELLSGDTGNFSRLVWSTFNTGGTEKRTRGGLKKSWLITPHSIYLILSNFVEMCEIPSNVSVICYKT